MSAVCSICKRDDRPAIEECHIAGMSLRAIAKAHPGTTAWSLRRHFQHVPAIIDQQQKLETRQMQNDRATAKLPARVEHLIAELERLTSNALRRKDFSSALRALATRLQCLRMIGEMTGELRRGGPVGELVPGNLGAVAATSVTVNVPGPTTTDPDRFVRLLKEIYGLSESHVKAAADRRSKIDPIM